MKTGACLTTYREDAGELIRSLEKQGLTVFLVDAETTGVRRGIGPCLVEAWRRALNAGCDQAIQIDAGGSHDPLEIPKLLKMLEYGSDVVIGSRFCSAAKYIGNPRRALMSRFAALLCNLRAGTSYTDWTSGYRAFSRRALWTLSRIPYRTDMHTWQIEVLDWALMTHLTVTEVPITYRAGRSSFNRKIAVDSFGVWKRLSRHTESVAGLGK